MHAWKKILGVALLAAAPATSAAADPTPADVAAQLKKLSDTVESLRSEVAGLRRQVEDLRKGLKTEEVRGSNTRADLSDLRRRVDGPAGQQAFYPPSRKAVAEEFRRAQAELDALDLQMEKRRAAALEAAVDADGDVRDLRSQIRKARDDLDVYIARGYNLNLPTPLLDRRTIAVLQPQLDRRVKQIEQELRLGSQTPEPLRQARLDLLERLARLQKLHDGLAAEGESPKGR